MEPEGVVVVEETPMNPFPPVMLSEHERLAVEVPSLVHHPRAAVRKSHDARVMEHVLAEVSFDRKHDVERADVEPYRATEHDQQLAIAETLRLPIFENPMEVVLVTFSVDLFNRLSESLPKLVEDTQLNPGHLAGLVLPIGLPTTGLVDAAFPIRRFPGSHESNELIADVVGVAELFDTRTDARGHTRGRRDGRRDLLSPTTVGPADRPR
jgi:hypothetical protein